MATIERDVSLLQRRRVAPIYIVYGSAVQIQLNMIDYTIPTNATVEFFAQCGNGPVYRADGSATGNSAVFTPQEGFFQKGDNALQLEINGRLIPLALDVKCEERISGVGSEETPEQVRPLVLQAQDAAKEAMEAAVSSAEAAAAADGSAESAGQNATDARSAATSAGQSANAAGESANAALNSKNAAAGSASAAAGSASAAAESARLAAEASKNNVKSVAGVSPDSAGNVALTPDNIGADAKEKYGKLVVFGDSLGQGVNNDDYSFVDIMSASGVFASVTKACVGSATIGPYQVDSYAEGYSLTEQIERYSADVAAADIIMLEYGGNDVVAYNAGNIQMGSYSDTSETVSVCGYLAKAMERIRALNPTATIVWLAAFWDSYDLTKNMVDAGYADAWLLFQATAIRLARPYLTGVIPIFSGLSDAHISSDGIHPNTAGHRQIANKITVNPFGVSYYPRLHRVLTLTGDVESGTDLSIDAGYPVVKALIGAGVTIWLEYNQYGGPMMLRPFVHNDYMMQFTGLSYLNGTYLLIAVDWEAGGNIAAYNKGV